MSFNPDWIVNNLLFVQKKRAVFWTRSLAIALLRKQFVRVIFVVYAIKKDENTLPQEQESKERVYELSQPRQHQMGKQSKLK